MLGDLKYKLFRSPETLIFVVNGFDLYIAKILLSFNNINEVVDTLTTLQLYIFYSLRLQLLSNNDKNIIGGSFETVQELLINYLCTLEEDKRAHSEFIMEQFNLLNCKKERYRNSGYVVLPDRRTIQRVCANHITDPRFEETDINFLSYIKQRYTFLKESERTVSLMLDEIHIKPFIDYKGGNIVGTAYNSEDAATTAHVFMVQSLLSSFKEVVHILPVKKINAEKLFNVIKKVILGLHTIGLNVICVVSDNNSINRKAMSLFSTPPKSSIVYPHPYCSNSPLFYILDSFHILFKCIRNNWINHKDRNQSQHFPNFENFSHTPLAIASFSALKRLHQIECLNLIKYSYGLTLKSLNPSSFERQNVKLVLSIFNPNVNQALLVYGEKQDLPNYKTTAGFINLICKWWDIVNVKSPGKGCSFRNPFQNPLTVNENEENIIFPKKFLEWLDYWAQLKTNDINTLTKETHLAITNTTYAFLEMSKYCINELKFEYFLPGKIQTDALEARRKDTEW